MKVTCLLDIRIRRNELKSTATEKILARGAGKEYVKPGELIMADLDLVLGNEITSSVAIKEWPKFGKEKVFDKDKIVLTPDHFTPNKDIKAAEQCKCMREFAKKEGIKNYFEVGRVGIEHALLPEKGLVTAGDIVVGADSHTCTYGALGAFSTGIGSTDMAAAMATGKLWFKVPSSIKFNISGKFRPYVSGKDLILYIIGKIGVDGALYKAMEYTGEGIKNLSMDDRFTIANMAIEAGAKSAFFPVDENALKYLREHGAKEPRIYTSDEGSEYDAVYDINLEDVPSLVAYPHLPENTHDAKEGKNIKIDQVVIGSCTNGRISDLKAAAEILDGHKVHPDVRCIIIPATQRVYKEAMENGYLEIFLDAGCVISAPTCGPCLGGHMGVLAKGERCVSTTNRNFIGRMGDKESEVYLASPATAAASAVNGVITDPREFMEGK